MKCPVCDNVNESMVCVRCGFDSSRDCEKYPTFGPVGEVSSVSALRKRWRERQELQASVEQDFCESRKTPESMMHGRYSWKNNKVLAGVRADGNPTKKKGKKLVPDVLGAEMHCFMLFSLLALESLLVIFGFKPQGFFLLWAPTVIAAILLFMLIALLIKKHRRIRWRVNEKQCFAVFLISCGILDAVRAFCWVSGSMLGNRPFLDWQVVLAAVGMQLRMSLGAAAIFRETTGDRLNDFFADMVWCACFAFFYFDCLVSAAFVFSMVIAVIGYVLGLV